MPRDQYGTVVGTAREPVQLDPREAFFRFWSAMHVPRHRVEELWQAEQARAKAIAEQARQRQRQITAQREKRRRKGRG